MGLFEQRKRRVESINVRLVRVEVRQGRPQLFLTAAEVREQLVAQRGQAQRRRLIGVARLDQPHQVKVVGNGHQRSVRLDQLEVLEHGHVPVDVADHVLKQVKQGHLFVVQLLRRYVLPVVLDGLIPSGHEVYVFDQEGVPGERIAPALCIDVGDAKQADAEALLREQIVDPVDQVFLQEVLFVHRLATPAVGHQLDLVLPGEAGLFDAFLREVEPQGREVAVVRMAAIVTPRARFEGHGDRRVVRGLIRERGGVFVSFFANVVQQGFEVRLQGQFEHLVGRKQTGGVRRAFLCLSRHA